jgi:phage FluMu protein Com
MKIQSDLRDIRCPSCSTPLHTSGLTRRRKVQCPKCRETVDLAAEAAPERAPTAPPPLPDPHAAEIAELRARVAHLEALEARVAELERALETAATAPIPQADRPPTAKHKIRWMPHGDLFRDAGFSEEAASILVHNLSAVRPHAITIRSPAGDAAARDRAQCFKDLFERGKWSVRGPHDTYAPVGERGLILAVRTFPVPAEVTAAFIALTASGFSVISRLDPHLDSDEALLIVA